MQYKIGQHVSAKGKTGIIVQIHCIFDICLYTIQPDVVGKIVFTISEEEIKLC